MAAKKLPFEALVFDLGGVLVGHDNESLFHRLAQSCSVPDALPTIRAKALDPRYNTGALTIAELHEALRRELGYRLDWNGFRAEWSSHFNPDTRMLALVQELAPANRILLFSNTNAEHWRYLVDRTEGALGRFEAYLSYELGLAKPSLEAFGAVTARAGIDPRASLFIDDVAENVAAARSVGFAAELFVGQAALERVLAKAGRSDGR